MIDTQYSAEVWQNISETIPKLVCEWPFKHIPKKGDRVVIENASYEIENIDYQFDSPDNPDPLLEVKIWVT